MINQTIDEKENDLAEKCRLALEKSWGTSIPKPNFPRKHSMFK